MGTNYPGAVDSLTNPAAGDALNSPSHAAQHANANDAIEAVQTELGANPSGSEATVVARLDKIEDGTRLGTGSVGATQLANDAVDTAAIQAKAVTAAKIADDTITATQIAANAVGASELADNAVDTAAIADGAVTAAQLATTGRFLFPTGAANGYGFASGAVNLSGTGSPEGAVTAAPGSTWLQTDSTTDVKGWIKWIKATGTGNTGWVVGPEADTGWRNVAALLTADATAKFQTWTTVHLRRVGGDVHFRMIASVDAGTAGGTSSDLTTITLPSGFRPAIYATLGTVSHYYASKLAVLTALSSKSQPYLNPIGATWSAGGATVDGFVMWPTDEAWPASLPGSAV